MNLLIPTRQYDAQILEMMEQPDADPEMLRDELKNLRRINKYFGGLSAICKSVLSLLHECNAEREIRVLDLGTGSADLPIHLLQCVGTPDRRLRIIAVDNNSIALQVSRERTEHLADITIEQGDLLDLNYAPRTFDIVLCSLTLHHFSNENAVRIVKSMSELSRIGFVLHDLNRSWLAAWAARLYGRLTTTNPMTIYDGYLSVLRGFTPDELRVIAQTAGVQKFEIRTHPFFRLLLIGKH